MFAHTIRNQGLHCIRWGDLWSCIVTFMKSLVTYLRQFFKSSSVFGIHISNLGNRVRVPATQFGYRKEVVRIEKKKVSSNSAKGHNRNANRADSEQQFLRSE